ncbi:hypothetical protein BGW36DRAFT_394898 [Talaromyces proteolyticus]|uniref:Uncharacterized protein n=1 Tax=Talaromyces proteolyticus TaxID=1131652 RepID=A0AAD4Q3V1_9EURO|nr:uncharacterized protein BGW36DRAFT_394898 [Talaromyces proteolyticus]KAH8702188.1 hypothetical protein BGW36DRAFT_394898 [Talaromyces proteolyticus]
MAARVQAQNKTPDYRMYKAAPPRKPVAGHAGLQFQPAEASSPQQQGPDAPNFDKAGYAHQRNRTSSSNVLPYAGSNHHHHYNNFHPQKHHHGQFLHRPSQQHTQAPATPSAGPTRTLSNATSSTNSTGNNYLTQTMSSVSSDIQRSASSRSAAVPLSYVALMRRQKGTVWCDRAQPEDPRLQSQKRAAKQRAYLELNGASGRTGTLASGKIRHQSGKAGPAYSPSTLVGATVPVRLSANEVGDDDEDDHSHRRASGSARSSLGSMHRYPSGYQRPPGKTPPNEQANIPEVAETAPVGENQGYDSSGHSSLQKDHEAAYQETHPENDFGDIGEMAAPPAADTAMQKVNKADDLRRRGSVDDRTTSLTGVRLFVANPDQDD